MRANRTSRRGPIVGAVLALAALAFAPRPARAQACCVGASGLTPGWLANHERFLVGGQLRLSHTVGAYPVSGPFYAPPPGRDARLESSLFASGRFLPRGQVSVFMPAVTTRRRVEGRVESATALGDLVIATRYEFIRAGESRIPGIAMLAGVIAPTGKPSDQGTGFLAPDTTGIGAWEANAGVSFEQNFRRVVAHTTALLGLRTSRDVFGVTTRLGPRALFLAAGGYVFEGEVTLLGTLSHAVEGDATVAGDTASGTGFRTTQAALLAIVPIGDTWRLRASVFADLPPLGTNRQALGGSTISILRSFM